ncbi:hypothetical protein H0H81_005191 [Sphagnurus paluster]|uniref:Uncharacterized protein n=1 Tax=Sphagnurus paluster TaxID=117069 RepID=A0A9P7FLF7_9AGAR|nr:hypothetical protein H0H81_005191 [Sphagnurus paluster]
MAASAFKPVIAILHHLLQRDLKGEIYINKMIHRNTGKDAAANFAFIIDAISPLLSKMAKHKVQLDHSNPEVAAPPSSHNSPLKSILLKGKGKGKGKATLGPSPSQAESSNTGRSVPQLPPTGVYTMPFSWDKEMEHISTQGAAELEANLPPVCYNPPPPAEYINPPTATSFAARAF